MKYYFWILGCAMNYSDAERIASVLDSLGYAKTDNEKEADLFIVIACSVRQSAINRIYGKIRDLNELKTQNSNFRTALSGCVLEKDRKKLEKVFDVIFDIKDLEKLPALLSGQNPESSPEEYLSVTPHYESSFRAYVPISTGCDNFCTYCAVPYTRGREKSRPTDEIIDEVKSLIENGYKEVTLLGQNVNSYGHDLGGKENNLFIELLKNIDEIPSDYRVYFYSNHPKDMTEELVKTIRDLKHFPKYIHLPLQSGNDEILKKMNRCYNKADYLNLVQLIRTNVPNVTLTTDIIVGFPTENEQDFYDTLEVMKAANYDMAFIAQYSSRPGTVSAKMTDDVSEEEKIRREEILQKALAETVLANNEKLVGTTQKVLVDEKKGEKFYGRTEGYKVVEIKTDQPLEIGRFENVKIDSATAWKLLGDLV